jgi:cell division protein FtsB
MSLSGFDTPKLPPRRREHAWTGRVLCFAACVLAVNALIGERGLSETLRARQDFNAAVAALSRLQYENAVLADTIRRLEHDAPTIEHVARAELGLIRPGEILVVVKPSSTPARPADATKTDARTKTVATKTEVTKTAVTRADTTEEARDPRE